MSGHRVPCCRYSKLAIERPRSGNEGGNDREREREREKTENGKAGQSCARRGERGMKNM